MDQTCFSGACGRSIEKLHRFLNKELLSPGYHYRKSILLQAYMLHPETAHVRAPILIVSKQSLASNKFISMARFWKNNLVSKPQILASLLSSKALTKIPPPPPFIFPLINMLSYIGCISNELGVPSSLLGLNYLTADDLEKHFVSATKIYEKSLRMQSAEEAEEFRQRSFERLHALLIRDMKPVEQGPPCKLVPSTPVFGFNVFTDEPPKAGEMPSVGTPLNVPYSGAMRQLFREIVVKCRERMLEAGGRAVPRVKMGIIGGDKLLQLVAGTLIFVCKEIQLSAENIPIDFYLVPVEESSFGQEFSRVDPWFRTHVCEALQYAAAVSPPFLFAKEVQQTLRHYDEFELRNQQQKRERRVLQESLVEECSGPATPNPPALVERVLTGLFEDARVSFRLPISLCLCWQMEGRFTVSFPFFTECRVFPQDRRAQHSFAVALSYHLKHIDGNVSDLVSVSRSVTSIRILQRWDLQDCLELVMKPSSTDLLASAGNGTSVGGNGGGGNGTVMASAGAGTGGSGGSGSGSGSGNGGSGNGVGGPGGVGSSSGASSLSSSVGSMSSSGAALAGMSAAAAAGGGGGGSGSGSGGNGGGGGSVGANGDIGLGGAGSLFKAEITAIDIKLDGPPGKPLVVVLDKHQYGPFLKVRCIQTQYSLPCKKFVEFS